MMEVGGSSLENEVERRSEVRSLMSEEPEVRFC